MIKHRVVFLQRKTRLAGAQKSLLRLLKNKTLAEFSPLLVCEDKGWLYQSAVESGLDVIVLPFPKARSLKGRLFSNNVFVRKLIKRLNEYPSQQYIIHGNEYDESLLSLRLAKKMKSKSVLSIRAVNMALSDWNKYLCDQHSYVIAVGPSLYQKAMTWASKSAVYQAFNGIDESELRPIKLSTTPIKKVAVIGSDLPVKGWQDFAKVIRAIDSQSSIKGVEIDFVGRVSLEQPKKHFDLLELNNIKVSFVGSHTAFIDFLCQYDLVVNPSRGESFGMAVVECIAAGLPVLTTNVGIVAQVINEPSLLVEPRNVQDMQHKLEALLQNSSIKVQYLEQSQDILRQRFSISDTANKIVTIYRKLLLS